MSHAETGAIIILSASSENYCTKYYHFSPYTVFKKWKGVAKIQINV